MKVLFLGFPITHYNRDFFNCLNGVHGISVLQIQPLGKNQHLGDAVYETTKNITFSSYQLEEVLRPAKRILGQFDFELSPSFSDFLGLPEFIFEHRPNIIVVEAAYFALATYNREFRKAMKSVNCKTVFHSIPFDLKTYPDTLKEVRFIDRLPLRKSRILRLFARVAFIDRLYARLVRNSALAREQKRIRRVFCNTDAHVIYHEQGVSIYRSWGVPSDRIHVVRNSPDTDKLIAARTRMAQKFPDGHRQPNRVIHVGRLVAWKRVDLLVRAIAKLKSGKFPNADLLVVGYGPCEAELKNLAAELNITDAVRFRGGIYEPDDLARCFQSSSIYVLAGMGGLSINDAMCFGLPVVCSRCDGTEKFLVRQGYNGFYFREGDLDDLSEKIAALFQDENLCRKMGAGSIKIIEEEMNIHILVNNYLKVFRALMESCKS